MEKYGLIGHPLGHSFSRNFFTDKFDNEGIKAQYLNFDISSIDELPNVLAANPELKGFNVTIPYKQKIFPFLDEISKEAREIGAVNVVKVVRKGNTTLLFGHNSDVIGFTESIEPFLLPHHKKALVLGTGGASKAICHSLTKRLNIETVCVSRYQRPGTVTYEQITPSVVEDYPVIVNCTPVGMFPKISECPPLPYESMSERNLLFDLVYNPEQTLFMRKGAQHGAIVKNGLEMLLLQAIASWNIWKDNS